MSEAENAVEKAASPTCSTCPSFQDERGECRLEPPKVHLVPVRSLNGDGLQPVSIWPPVQPDMWCSQHPDLTELEAIEDAGKPTH